MSDYRIILSGRTKRLPNYSYKLAGGGSYGMDVTFPDEMQYDESRMSLVIPFADGNNRDGVGDILEVTGIDVSRHRKNPIVLFDHGKQVQLPIGLAEDRDSGQYTVEIDGAARTAKLNCFFYQGTGLQGMERSKEYNHALFCEQLFDMGVKKLVRGGSIGYQVIDADELPPDYQRGISKGLHLKRTLMLEGSFVVLPANADTVGKMLCDGFRCCGKALCPMLVKCLEPYAPYDTKVVSGYEGKAHDCHCGGACATCRAKRGSVNGPGRRYKNPLSNERIPPPRARQSWTGSKATPCIGCGKPATHTAMEEGGTRTFGVCTDCAARAHQNREPAAPTRNVATERTRVVPPPKQPGQTTHKLRQRRPETKGQVPGVPEGPYEAADELDARTKRIKEIRARYRKARLGRGRTLEGHKSLDVATSVPLGRIYLSHFGSQTCL